MKTVGRSCAEVGAYEEDALILFGKLVHHIQRSFTHRLWLLHSKFSQKLEGKGAVATFELSQPGVYPYFCERHRSMRGEIRVK